jgi:hypothetical protein
VNTLTHALSAVEYVAARGADFAWGPWGDIRFRHRFGLWFMEPGGLVLPRLRVEERNGVPYRSTTILKITINPEIKTADLAIPPEVRQLFTLGILQTVESVPFGVPGLPVRELATGLHLIPGRLSMVLVRQDDGVVVVEAPISSGHSKKLMEEANWRSRGAPLKAVVSAGDGYHQIGGLREFVAAGVPIYAPALNQNLLEKFVAAPHTILPDSLSQKPAPAQWNWVSGKTAIGKGANAIELYPLNGAGSERALMVYFPAHKFLYAGQYLSRSADGSLFMPSYAAELIAAVEREKLKVGLVFGAQASPMTWDSFLALYQKARAGVAPASPPAPPAAKPKP